MIRVVATDAIEVVGVTFRIQGADHARFEAGPAVKDHGIWHYRTTVTLPPDTPWRIEVTARNRAEAEATQTVSRTLSVVPI